MVQVQYSARERVQAAGNWRVSMAPLYERRTGPRKVALEPTLAPETREVPEDRVPDLEVNAFAPVAAPAAEVIPDLEPSAAPPVDVDIAAVMNGPTIGK